MKNFGRIEEGTFVEAPGVLRKVVSNPTEKEYTEFGYSPVVWDDAPEYDPEKERLIEGDPYTDESGTIHRCFVTVPLENIEAEAE
jgi:hypothetical protein